MPIISGKLIFDPMLNGKPCEPYWAIIQLECDISEYYAWFLQRRYGISVIKPLWGPHVSVIRGEICDKLIWDKFKSEFNNKDIQFEYENGFKTNGQHWWLRVVCDEMKQMRENMGYQSNGIGLHLTIGKPKPLHIQQTQYIHTLFKKGLIE